MTCSSVDSTESLRRAWASGKATTWDSIKGAVALSVTLPDGISGDYYVSCFRRRQNLTFNPPPSGLVLEFQDEGNNITAQPLPITLTNPPDLQVTKITVPTHVTAGQILDVSWTVTNEASGDTPPRQAIWNDYVYLSEDTHLERLRDRFLGFVQHVGGLAAGGNYDVNQSYRLGASLDGLFYVIVSTDPPWGTYNPLRGDVFELDRENNNTLASDPLVIERPPPADLQVDSVSIPATAQTGAPVRVTWTASNHGQFPAAGSWTDSVYLSADDTWSLDDVPLGKVAHHGSLANGQGYAGSLDATLPSVRDGNYRVIVRADLFDEVYEGTVDEQNNMRAAPGALVVSVPPLRLNVVENTSLSTDQGRLYRLDVAANQTIRLRLTTSAAEAANEIYVRYGDAPSALVHDFSHSGPLQANQELLIPGTQAGVYYVLVRGQSEPTANTPIQLLAEALPFQITDIVQDKGGDSRYVTATILGAQFAPNAIVKLVRPGFAEMEPVRYRVVDGTKIVAVFDFRSAPHGLYDVTVINPNGDQANLPYRFLVEQAIEPDLIIGLGGTRVLWAGETGYYGLSLINATNVDLPYVQVEVGIPEQGLSPLGPRYTTLSNNLSGTAQVPDVPWASLDSTVNTSGYNLAPGYALDLVNRGFAGFNFTAMTYLGPATGFPEDGYPPPRLDRLHVPDPGRRHAADARGIR